MDEDMHMISRCTLLLGLLAVVQVGVDALHSVLVSCFPVARSVSRSTSSSTSTSTSTRLQKSVLFATRKKKKSSRKDRRQKWAEEEEEAEPLIDESTPLTAPASTSARTARRQKWIDRAEASEEAAQVALLTQEYRQQRELQASPKPQQLIRVSQDPLIFTIDDFIDPAACERVQANGAGCFDLMFPERISDLLFQGQESEMDGLLFNAADSRQHLQKGTYPDGLHMDTNGQCLFRHVTCLLYLNTIPAQNGGATVFPLARALPNDPVLAASQRLLDEKISHTRSRAVTTAGLTREALLLESRTGSNFPQDIKTETAIRIQPKAGRLLIFFSRKPNGQEDPRAWHSGEQILPDAKGNAVQEKRILTLFKQVDYNAHPPTLAQTTFEQFLAPQIQQQQQWLQWKAQDQSPVSYSKHQTE